MPRVTRGIFVLMKAAAIGAGGGGGGVKAGNEVVQREDELAASVSMNCLVFGPTVALYGGIP